MTSTTSPSTSTSAKSTTLPATTSTAQAVNYGQQYLADVAPVNTALAHLGPNPTLTSAGARESGRQAVNSARLLLTQSWPSADVPDVHNLAAQFDTIDADIVADNFPQVSQ